MKRIGAARRWPVLARAPQTSNRGTDGIGSAPCSATIHKNKTAYPCRITNSAVSFIQTLDSIRRLRIHRAELKGGKGRPARCTLEARIIGWGGWWDSTGFRLGSTPQTGEGLKLLKYRGVRPIGQ